jgi:hypothetical protein
MAMELPCGCGRGYQLLFVQWTPLNADSPKQRSRKNGLYDVSITSFFHKGIEEYSSGCLRISRSVPPSTRITGKKHITPVFGRSCSRSLYILYPARGDLIDFQIFPSVNGDNADDLTRHIINNADILFVRLQLEKSFQIDTSLVSQRLAVRGILL